VTSWYPTPDNPVGGVFVREHARAVALHHDVTILHIVARPERDARPWRVEEDRDPELTQGIKTFRVRRAWHGESYPLKLYSAFRSARRLNPDIIHAHIYEAAVPGTLAARSLGIPVVSTEHWTGFSRHCLNWRQVVQTRAGHARVDRLLPVSSELANAMRRYVGSRVRMEVVPNVVDTTLFRPGCEASRSGPRRILFAGLLDEGDTKNLPLLLKALAVLREMAPAWVLDVVGDGPGRARCEAVAAALGLTTRVFFHGLRRKNEVADFMRAADLLVLPSKWENMPCVVVEALASGTPVLATSVGGLPEMINSSNGSLVAPGDVHALSEALKAMLDESETFDRGAIAADARAKYSLGAVGAQFDALYRHVVSERAQGERCMSPDGDTL
jgi:glycosyltransferase involved in cell wall biosynthesis